MTEEQFIVKLTHLVETLHNQIISTAMSLYRGNKDTLPMEKYGNNYQLPKVFLAAALAQIIRQRGQMPSEESRKLVNSLLEARIDNSSYPDNVLLNEYEAVSGQCGTCGWAHGFPGGDIKTSDSVWCGCEAHLYSAGLETDASSLEELRRFGHFTLLRVESVAGPDFQCKDWVNKEVKGV
ncbi:MAG: hypothetical protein PHF31_06895 [Methylobacter sp.]|nr:hypothetical protein [Methylobacter sp.]